jgi:hypothetical protein
MPVNLRRATRYARLLHIKSNVEIPNFPRERRPDCMFHDGNWGFKRTSFARWQQSNYLPVAVRLRRANESSVTAASNTPPVIMNFVACD